MGVEYEEIESSCPLLDVNKVPRKYLMLCSTLRYLLRYSSEKKGFLSRVELDAVLATAVSPIIKNVALTKEMKLPKVHPRAITVAALLMQVLIGDKRWMDSIECVSDSNSLSWM